MMSNSVRLGCVCFVFCMAVGLGVYFTIFGYIDAQSLNFPQSLMSRAPKILLVKKDSPHIPASLSSRAPYLSEVKQVSQPIPPQSPGTSVEILDEEQLCNIPQLELYPNEDFNKYFKDIPEVVCPGEEWANIETGVFKISKSAQEKYGRIRCSYTPILRGGNDFEFHFGHAVKNVVDGWNVTSEGSKVTCKAQNASYSNYHLTIPYIRKFHQREQNVNPPKSSLNLNVLVFGFDSVSRMTWLRKLPKTYAYMRDVLGSVVLEGYNIVDDGTLGAFFPILTGFKERELASAAKGVKGTKTVDKNPWIWKDFEKAGYVHQYSEDVSPSTFTWRLNGFKKQPTDHYALPFYSELENYRKRHRGLDMNSRIVAKFCVGSKFRHSLLLNYMKDFEKMYKYKRRFSLGFSCDLSHNHLQPLNIADDETKEWIQALHEGGYRNNTLLLLMSDHGTRYIREIRETLQGSVEERNPFVSVRMPPWFRETYPLAYRNLLANSKRLTTPFDIHATFHDILNFKNKPRGSLSDRGISLLSEIPAERLCSHAGVTPHYCNCLKWTSANDPRVTKEAARAFVDFLNQHTKEERKLCHVLEVDQVVEAKVLAPHDLLIGWKERADVVRVQTGGIAVYRLVIHTKPGGAHFETTVEYHEGQKKYHIKIGDISRTNAYGSDADCLADKPSLSKFCFCRK